MANEIESFTVELIVVSGIFDLSVDAVVAIVVLEIEKHRLVWQCDADIARPRCLSHEVHLFDLGVAFVNLDDIGSCDLNAHVANIHFSHLRGHDERALFVELIDTNRADVEKRESSECREKHISNLIHPRNWTSDLDHKIV